LAAVECPIIYRTGMASDHKGRASMTLDLFPGVAPGDMETLIDDHRRAAFLANCRLRVTWLAPAYRHKRAADILYEIASAAAARFSARWSEKLKNPRPEGTGGRLVGADLDDHLSMELVADYFLLAGYAFECVFKGYLLAILPELVVNDEKLDKLIATHDLRQLCKDCGIAVSADESRLLAYITQYIIWGKYPCPLKATDMPCPFDPKDREANYLDEANPYQGHRIKELIDGLFKRSAELLEAQRPRS